MFKRFYYAFWAKAVEWFADQGLNNALNMKDFEHNLETLRENLNRLSAQAGDVEEKIEIGERSGRKKRKREVEVWLKDVKSIEEKVDKAGSQVESQGFVVRRLMDGGGKVARLNMQVEKLIQQRQDVGEPVLDAGGTKEEILLTNGMVGKASNENLEMILKLLENRQVSQVSKIGVYGMGGVGKTTLAKHVYNRLRQQSHGCVFWITVSQEFTIRSLQDKIASCLSLDLSNEDEEVMRAGRLNSFLSQMKNSVLILDDVWEKIDMLKVGCEFSVKFCRLIITTRSLEVCRRIGCQREIHVEILHAGESWKLFKETLGTMTELDAEVEGIAKDMVKLCGGLPLGIITVAGSMRGERESHRWRHNFRELQEYVKGKDGMGEDEDEVFKVLRFSFDRLKKRSDKSNGFNKKQLCFLYCSLYPEDYKIDREDLVREFISEGLGSERESRRARVDQAHSILDELVGVCLLENFVDRWNSKSVKMHDLVRSMALRICKGKYLVRAGERSLTEIPNQEEWTEDLEKVSLVQCDIRRIGEEVSPDCPNLSTLLLSRNRELKVIPDSFFSKMQGLCTLDLCGNFGITMLPDSISEMTRLKSLLLQNCYRLEKVPYLGKMKALRELGLSNTAIKESPQGLEELLDLRFLSMNADGLKKFPKGLLLKLGHLQHLSLPFFIKVKIEEIKNLKQLEEFGGGVENVSDFNWFITNSKVHNPGFAIHLGSRCTTRFGYGRDLGGKNNELVLSGKNVKDEKVLASRIAYLTISECEGMSKGYVDDLLERFDNPTSLKRLDISGCGGIEWIFTNDLQGSRLTLEAIRVGNLDDLIGVVMQPTAFQSLKSLDVYCCGKMRKVGLPVSALPSLEELSISYCREVEEIFEEEDEGRAPASTLALPKLKKLRLTKLPRVRKVGLAASGVPILHEIVIECCEGIEEIFEEEEEDEGRAAASTLALPKLSLLKLRDLPRVRKVGLAPSGVPLLQEIDIERCKGIEEIFEEEEDSILILHNLKQLHLRDLPRLKRVSKATIISNSIQKISIHECSGLMNKLPLHFDGPTPPPSLGEIKVDRKWWDSLKWDNPRLPQLLRRFVQLQDSCWEIFLAQNNFGLG